MNEEPRAHPFRDSKQDVKTARHVPDTPQTRAPA
ncbi:MAG: lysine decarboxylase, partial [Paracoccaceae bacterium]